MGKERALSGPAGKGKPGKLRGQCPGDWGKGQKPGKVWERATRLDLGEDKGGDGRRSETLEGARQEGLHRSGLADSA